MLGWLMTMDNDVRRLERSLNLTGQEVKVISLSAYQSVVLYLFRARFKGEAGLRWMNEHQSPVGPGSPQYDSLVGRLAETNRLLLDLGGCFRDHTALISSEKCSICLEGIPDVDSNL